MEQHGAGPPRVTEKKFRCGYRPTYDECTSPALDHLFLQLHAAERRRREERLLNRITNQVQLRLEAVDKFVQALLENVADLQEIELGAETAQVPLTGVRKVRPRTPVIECSDSSALIRQKCMARGKSRSRIRKSATGRGRCGPAPCGTSPGRSPIPGAADHWIVVERRADVGDRGQQHVVLHVEDARGLVGTLQQAAHAGEVPGLAVRHRGVGDALQQVARPV